MKSFLLSATFVAFCLLSLAQTRALTNDPLPALFTYYYQLKDALVKDDAQQAASSAAQLVTAIQSIDVKTLTASEQLVFNSLKEKLRYNAQHISEVQHLDHQREHFAALSGYMFTLAQSVPSLAQPVYLDYCPMKKLHWLSNEKTIENPYYGQAMFDCGNVEKTVIPSKKSSMKMDTMKMSDSGMNGMNMDTDTMKMDDIPGMSHSYSRSLPMTRNGSGTSWSPDSDPMYMIMKHTKKGMWMFHGSIFIRYNNQQLTNKTSRSGAQFDAPNWFMVMYNRPVGKNGLFNFTAMVSLDPLTVTARGYPLLFQTGESYKGQPLVDRQHPHDLFSGLSVAYTQRLSKKADVFGYVGYPGEPAISAPTFMHRIIALNDPDAPLSHHWQDATHITFGVATAGVRVGKLKGEFSSFTGREPDEHRYNFDKPRFDSYSWRLSFNPSAAWALQVSQAFIKSPEDLHPDEDVMRYTASALYSTQVSIEGNYFTAAVVWGMNHEGADKRNEHSVLVEGTQQLAKQAIYGRYEFVQKSAEELNVEQSYGERSFDIHKLTIGTNRQLFSIGFFQVVGGLQSSVNIPPPSLQLLYGKTPISGQVYIEIRPKLMKM